MRVIAPTFAAELKEQSALFAGWGALAVLGAGMLCLAQSEPKKCAAWFTLAGGGLAWFLMSSGSNSAWDAAVVFTWGGTALLALVSVMDERQPITRAGGWNGLWQSAPRWSAALVVTIGSLVGFPAAARWPLDWQLAWQLAGARPGPFFVAMTGWFITGWAVVWMMQRWLWGTTASAEITSNTVLDSVDDLRRSETAAMAVLLIVMALVASGWWTAEMVTPATPTGESRAALGAGLP
jgi:NADH:ubiquinone oxidoreductase subunit 4 (subunit M)